MRWRLSHRCDPLARELADRHYNRQSIGADNFVPPGRCLVLWTPGAFWVTSWPLAEYVRHAWAGAWMCSAFRNERPDLYLSSELIREAVAATRARYGEPPALGMVTFVDRDKTQGGLVALQLLPDAMPRPEYAIGAQPSLLTASEALS